MQQFPLPPHMPLAKKGRCHAQLRLSKGSDRGASDTYGDSCTRLIPLSCRFTFYPPKFWLMCCRAVMVLSSQFFKIFVGSTDSGRRFLSICATSFRHGHRVVDARAFVLTASVTFVTMAAQRRWPCKIMSGRAIRVSAASSGFDGFCAL